MRKIALYINFAILLMATAGFTQQKQITVNSELQRLYDITQLPKYVDGTYEAQKSSYDTTGGNDDGFSGKYSFVRKNPDGTLVIFEAKGKGVINRIWTATPNDDIWIFISMATASHLTPFRFVIFSRARCSLLWSRYAGGSWAAIFVTSLFRLITGVK